jgi:hypothetical protein
VTPCDVNRHKVYYMLDDASRSNVDSWIVLTLTTSPPSRCLQRGHNYFWNLCVCVCVCGGGRRDLGWVYIWGLTVCHRLKTDSILGWLMANVTGGGGGQWKKRSAPSFN